MNEWPTTTPAPEEEDFNNVQTLNDAMVSDDPERLDRVKTFLIGHGITGRELDSSIAMQRLRRKTHEEAWAAADLREKERPEPTPEELSMGAYIEYIEPHVREAVRELRRKGYDTAGSGFTDLNFQELYLTSAQFDKLDEAARERLRGLGVGRIDDKSLSFKAYEPDLEKLRLHWNEIVAALPDLGASAPPSSTQGARDFRERHTKI